MARPRGRSTGPGIALTALGLAAAGALAACGSGASGSGCRVPADCQLPPGSVCRVATCDQATGACGTAPAPAGTALADPTPGDCHALACDGAGATQPVTDDTDHPADGACSLGQCTAGVPSQAPLAARTPCGTGGLCDGAGACLACLVAADCGAPTACAAPTCGAGGVCGASLQPIGTPCGPGQACDGAGGCAAACLVPADCPGADTECHTRTCGAAGLCGAIDAAAGTALSVQVAGDCRKAVCDGAGGATSVNDDGDVPPPAGACTVGACAAGVPSQVGAPARTPCGGGQLCDGLGACLACLAPADCGADSACAARTCSAGVCGISDAAPGTSCGSGQACDGAGTCAAVCPAGAPVQLTVKNYLSWCSVSLGGGAPSALPVQTACVAAGPVALSATALLGFQLGAAPWHDTDGDHGAGDPGTVTGSGQAAVSSTTVTVGGTGDCAWVCCDFLPPFSGACPVANQCP
jgi:hypothetical protein